jgi:hypothetical protein
LQGNCIGYVTVALPECIQDQTTRPVLVLWIILNHFKAHIPHSIHAIDIRAMTLEQAETTGDTVFHPHGDGQGIHVKSIEKRQSKQE